MSESEAPWTFTCKVCGYTGPSDWSRQDAEQESRELWGEVPPPGEEALVCDPCFEKFMAWMARENSA